MQRRAEGSSSADGCRYPTAAGEARIRHRGSPATHLEVIELIPPRDRSVSVEVDRFVDAFTAVMDDAHDGGLVWEFGRTLVKQAVADR
ncbi:hypothetical protein SHIRM173S_05585 [Streptomyces hirsutus]